MHGASARPSAGCAARCTRRRLQELTAWLLPVVGALLLGACSLTPSKPKASTAPAEAPASSAKGGSAGAIAGASVPGAAGAIAPAGPPPERAQADFQRAVGLMRAGNMTEAELEFQQVATNYPQYAAPDINLGILYRKSDRLDLSEQALRAAVERNPTSPAAWDELGVTLRMRGRFQDAAEAYRKAIAADPGFAPAYRNLGVLLDLYMGDPAGALDAMEHYKQISGEDKPVTGWIAELRQRVAKSSAQGAAPGGAAPGGAAPAKAPDGPAQAPAPPHQAQAAQRTGE